MTTPQKRKARRRNWKEWDRHTSKLGNDELARIRLSREPEPRMVKACRYQIKVRDTITGEVSDWVGLESARWAMRMATALNERTTT